jgi:hypothetical protein
MTESGVPRSLDAAIVQAKAAARAAIEAGVPRILVEICIPELKIMPVAEQFYPLFEEMGFQFKLYFPDAGAAALAKRDWGNPDFSIRGINEAKGRLEPDDDAFLIIEPSSVEVNDVEEFCNEATGKFVVMLNPQAGGHRHHRHRLRGATTTGTLPQHIGILLLPATAGRGHHCAGLPRPLAGMGGNRGRHL